MSASPLVSVVVPVRNEAGNVEPLITEIERALKRHKITRIVATEPGEWRVLEMMRQWEPRFGLPVEIREDDRFFCSRGRFARAGAERAAINAPMQGPAADLIKLSMVQVQKMLDDAHRRSRIIMQVHDELVFEVPEDELDWLRQAVPACMAQVADLKVPLLAEVGVGRNWEEAH